MSIMNSLAPHVPAMSFGQIIVDTYLDLRARRARLATIRQITAELESLSARELADIGISRGMIAGIARQSV